MKIKYFLIMLMVLLGISANAQFCSYTYEGSELLYYLFTESNSCAAFGHESLAMELRIPEVVTSNGQEYRVTSIEGEAFLGCSGLTSVTIPNSVIRIGSSAFQGCSGLTSVTIPNSVTSIGMSAFYGCSGLTSVIIGNSVTSIGWGAFSGCYGLKKSAYPNTLGNPFESGFSVGYDPKSAVIEDGIIYGPEKSSILFVPLTLEGEYTIPNSVTSIESSAFQYCRRLTSVTIPNSVTSIESSAFQYCSGLTSVTIPNSVTSIGESAFWSCSGLTSVTIPNSVTSIGKSAFWNCSGLKKSAYPNTLTNPFSNGLAVGYNPNGAIIEDGFIYGPEKTRILFAPFTLEGEYTIPNSVTSIGGDAFRDCSGLTSVTIPNSVTSIGGSAFYGCSGLTSVTIPNSVTSIGGDAFRDCSGLTSVTIPNSVTSIGSSAFRDCSNMAEFTIEDGETPVAFATNALYQSPIQNIYIGRNWTYTQRASISTAISSVTLGDKVTELPGYAFYGCSGLTSVTIPNSVTSIGGSAFEGCSGLTSVTIPNSVTTIGEYAFYGCSGLTSVTIPNSVTSIVRSAFYGCSGLTSVTIPNSVTSIGNYAFNRCSGLTSVTIPNSVTSIGKWAFYGCSGLTSVTIPNSVTSIGGGAFADCGGLTSVIIGNSVTSIGESAFEGCSGLKKSAYPNTLTNPFSAGLAIGYNPNGAIIEDGFIYGPEKTSILFAPLTLQGEYTIPNSVTSIGKSAFQGCSRLRSVIIPDAVTSIGDNAFQGCSSINAVTVYATEPPLFADNAFSGLYETARLSIPKSALYEYLGSNWALFKSLKIADSELTSKNYSDAGLDYILLAAETASEKNIAIVKQGDYSSLTSVTIPERFTADDSQRYYVTGISFGAFRDCANLKEVTFHSKSILSMIGDEAFMGSGISTITLPKTVTAIQAGVFRNCSGLTMMSIPNWVASIGQSAFQGCSGLTTVSIPNSVDSIGQSAFAACSSLSSVSFGSGVKAIPNNAFAGCKLSKVVLPPAVETVGISAFADNTDLTEVAMGAYVSSVGDKAFDQAPMEKVFITTPEPPTAPVSAFSRYAAKLFVQGEAAVGAYYDALSCWDKFEGYAMTEPQSLTMEKPESVEGLAGESFTLTATMLPADVDLPYIFWRSTDPTKAYVDNNGKVTVLLDIAADDDVKIIAETLYHNGPVAEFAFKANSSSDIATDAEGDNASDIDVFTLQGVQVLHNATRQQFDQLGAGIYIVRCGNAVKKVMKK